MCLVYDIPNQPVRIIMAATNATYVISIDLKNKFKEIDVLFRLTAIRETFEESGILLYKGVWCLYIYRKMKKKKLTFFFFYK